MTRSARVTLVLTQLLTGQQKAKKATTKKIEITGAEIFKVKNKKTNEWLNFFT